MKRSDSQTSLPTLVLLPLITNTQPATHNSSRFLPVITPTTLHGSLLVTQLLHKCCGGQRIPVLLFLRVSTYVGLTVYSSVSTVTATYDPCHQSHQQWLSIPNHDSELYAQIFGMAPLLTTYCVHISFESLIFYIFHFSFLCFKLN